MNPVKLHSENLKKLNLRPLPIVPLMFVHTLHLYEACQMVLKQKLFKNWYAHVESWRQ